MTLAELFAAVVAALEAAFTGSKFKVWPGPPDATALPAVWPQFVTSFRGAGRNAGGSVPVQIVVAIAPQIHVAECAALYDAHDRLDTIGSAALANSPISGGAGNLGSVDIGGVTYTALLYDLTVARSLPC